MEEHLATQTAVLWVTKSLSDSHCCLVFRMTALHFSALHSQTIVILGERLAQICD